MRDQILLAREKRMDHVKRFFNLYNEDSLIMIKANIPGDNKNFPYASYLIKLFFNSLRGTYSFFYTELFKSVDGPYFLCGVKGKNKAIKKHLIKLEDTHQLGRYIDLDYFDNPVKSLSRVDLNIPLRKCILCDNEALVCIKRQSHALSDILNTIEKRTVYFFADIIEDLVDYAILRELKIEDKFGLVTFTTSGSHDDMDYQTMLKAKDSILHYFKELFIVGYKANDLDNLLINVRQIGIDAENMMLQATGGVNSYKGVIFLLGFVALSFGYTFKTSTSFNDIFENIKIIAKDIYDDFHLDYDTVGVRLYHEYGITGIRGVAKDGFQIVKDNLDKISVTSSDQELRNLLHYYIVNTDDTVFIKRALSYENYLNYKKIIKNLDPSDLDELKELNDFTKRHYLSFGGSADLLITTIFLVNLRECFIKE